MIGWLFKKSDRNNRLFLFFLPPEGAVEGRDSAVEEEVEEVDEVEEADEVDVTRDTNPLPCPSRNRSCSVCFCFCWLEKYNSAN